MLSVEIDGGVELRDSMRRFTPDLAANMEKEIDDALYPIVRRARGFVPAVAPLSRWEKASRNKTGRFPWYNAMEIRQGIESSTDGTKPNRKGFAYAAAIYNRTAAGSILETAGRKNPNGRKQSPWGNYYGDKGQVLGQKRSFNKKQSMSNNPNAGRQFIAAMPPLYKSERIKGQSGRRSKKFDGRLIFRAWGEDQGRSNAAVLIAIDKTVKQFKSRMGYVRTRKAA